MALTLSESQAVDEMADLLYSFLPRTPHPAADQSRSFAGVADDLGIGSFWAGGSKRPAICRLLEQTLDAQRSQFCVLVVEIVRRGIVYRSGKGEPVTRSEIKRLNQLLERVRFKIPELWEPAFLDSLVPGTRTAGAEASAAPVVPLESLRQAFDELRKLAPHTRGFAFERFLTDLFDAFGLAPRGSFRLVGEQIDGSFQLDGATYLVEAKWQDTPIGNAELLAFRGKVEGKAMWTRGLFISHSGFSDDGLVAFARGRSTNIVAMTGQDVYFILEGRLALVEALRLKARHAAETGQALVSVYDLVLASSR